MMHHDKYYGREYRKYMYDQQKKARDKRQAKIVWACIVLFTILIWGMIIWVTC